MNTTVLFNLIAALGALLGGGGLVASRLARSRMGDDALRTAALVSGALAAPAGYLLLKALLKDARESPWVKAVAIVAAATLVYNSAVKVFPEITPFLDRHPALSSSPTFIFGAVICYTIKWVRLKIFGFMLILLLIALWVRSVSADTELQQWALGREINVYNRCKETVYLTVAPPMLNGEMGTPRTYTINGEAKVSLNDVRARGQTVFVEVRPADEYFRSITSSRPIQKVTGLPINEAGRLLLDSYCTSAAPAVEIF